MFNTINKKKVSTKLNNINLNTYITILNDPYHDLQATHTFTTPKKVKIQFL